MKLRVTGVLLAGAALAAAGCAHTQPPKPVEAPAPAPVVSAPAPAPAEDTAPDDVTAALSNATVHFDFDEAVLKPEGQQKLQRAAAALKRRPEISVRIAGHCDERGTAEYNLALGQRRAEAARTYLKDLGVQAGRMTTVSYGAEKPAVEGHDEAAYSQNRRGELELER